jgi:hypothetical protein
MWWSRRRQPMNKWGQLARAHWAQHLPHRYTQIAQNGDPEAYFSALGTQVASEIQILYQAMLHSEPPGMTPAEKQRWRATALTNAQNQTLEEMVLLAPEHPDNDPADPTTATMMMADIADEFHRNTAPDNQP